LDGADAETADRHEFLGVIADFFGQLSAGANADKVRVGDLFLELGFRQRTGDVLMLEYPAAFSTSTADGWTPSRRRNLILLLSREVLLICVNLYPGEKWQGIGSLKLTRTAGKPSPQKRPWALSCGGGMLAYAPR